MSEDRNTPREILFDMEDDLATLRRHGSTLLLISTTDGFEAVVQDALAQMAEDLLDCHRDLRDKYDRLFDQIVRNADDRPDPAKGFDATFEAWNTNRKQQHDVGDDEAERLEEQERKLLDQIVATRVSTVGRVASKVAVAKSLIEQVGSRWTDERDVKVLDSILADLSWEVQS